MKPRVLGVIPARIGSARLPRKPLTPLAGRPLIEWVWRRAREMSFLDRVVIATDSPEVRDAVLGFGAEAEMTSVGHPSGTDRVAEVAELPAYRDFGVVVNLQGDEPFISPEAVFAALVLVRDEGWEVGTAAARLRAVAEWRDPAVVKVVRDDRGGALLFSRAAVPHPRDAEPGDAEIHAGPYLRHLGVYAYRRDALLRWVALPEGVLERMERLEQLRPLAAGTAIGVAVVDAPIAGGVDTPEDAARADVLLRHPDLPAARALG